MSTVRALLALCIMAAVCDAKLRFLSSKPVGAAEAHNAETVPAFRRSYSSGSGTANSGSASATATPAPTPAATEAVNIVQVVTMSSDFTTATLSTYGASAYATAVNFGYGSSVGIVDSSNTETVYKTGCSVSSTAELARRADLSITFNAVVSASLAAAATTASQSLTAASLNTAVAAVITNLKVSDANTYSGLTAPTASAVATPTVTTVATGSASTNAVFSAVALLGAAALALKQ